MSTLKKMLKSSLLMLLLLALSASLSYSAELPQIKLVRVPDGYHVNEEGLRTIYSAIRTYREERDAWETSYHELSAQSTAFAEEVRREISDIKQGIADERAEWKKAIRKAKMPGLGLFVGGAYTSSGSIEAVAGVGLVFKLFNFLNFWRLF